MSEGFLQRWSRRKREKEPDATAPDPAEPDALEQAAVKAPPANETPAEPEFDLSSLPSLDEIGPGTKVDAFLKKGVPADLSRAALRRAWVSDPAIRDFVGLSENAWDFNATEGVPGFGPLEMTDDLRRLVAGMFTPPDPQAGETSEPQGVSQTETAAVPAIVPSNHGSSSIVDCESQEQETEQNEVAEVANNPADRSTGSESKSQHSLVEKNPSGPSPSDESITKLTRRGHGGAMPR
jgi:hypothetical protein